MHTSHFNDNLIYFYNAFGKKSFRFGLVLALYKKHYDSKKLEHYLEPLHEEGLGPLGVQATLLQFLSQLSNLQNRLEIQLIQFTRQIIRVGVQ